MKAMSVETMEKLVRLYYVLPMIKDNITLEAVLKEIDDIEKQFDIVILNGIIMDKE